MESLAVPSDDTMQQSVSTNGEGGDSHLSSDSESMDVKGFTQISYLGKQPVIHSNSESEIGAVMKSLNSSHASAQIDIVLTIPSVATQRVRLCDSSTRVELESYRVNQIAFCLRGQTVTAEANCVAFTIFHDVSDQYTVHVIRAPDADVCAEIIACFRAVFGNAAARGDAPPPVRPDGPLDTSSLTRPGPAGDAVREEGMFYFQFDLFLELKEDAGPKGGFSVAPQEKNCFKLRRGREKMVIVSLQQVSGDWGMGVQKCFGLLLAAGRNVRHADMHLLDMQSMGRGNDDRSYLIEALWDPNAHHFDVLNTESPKDTRVYMTVAADVVLAGMHEPVRFSVETRARIFHQHERFWYITRKPVVERYYLTVTKVDPSRREETPSEYEVSRFETATERERRLAVPSGAHLGRSPSKMPTNLISPAGEDESDSDEPPLSGSGAVSKECPQELLDHWSALLDRWRATDTQGSSPRERSREVLGLVRAGIPDQVRGEAWQVLAESNDDELMDTYRLLISKECPNEQVILRDIHRTFPAHDYFKDAGGVGQDQLYKLSKAYSLYDEEIGYCQGLSFLAAALLLHMPEEEAFCLLVRIMFGYDLRELFKQGFEALQLRFYQLECLIQDYIPDLAQHFACIGVEGHMYASQWFLTLFTAKFPLSMVFQLIDLFLLEASKKDLLQLDFEGALKYFRVVLPRKYRNEQNSKDLIQQAVRVKIGQKRLAKYERDYIQLKQQEAETQDPVERVTKENARLKNAMLRLERENDDLAHELVTSKIQLRNNLDAAEDNIEALQKQVEKLMTSKAELEDESTRLAAENEQVKEMCRRELTQAEEAKVSHESIIAGYKKICSDQSERLEKLQSKNSSDLKDLTRIMKSCPSCSQHLNTDDSTAHESPTKRSPGSEFTNGVVADPEVLERISGQDEMIRSLELELAQTKLALVETQCRAQDLLHDLNTLQQQSTPPSGSNATKWLNKTIRHAKEVVVNKAANAQNPEKSQNAGNLQSSEKSGISNSGNLSKSGGAPDSPGSSPVLGRE